MEERRGLEKLGWHLLLQSLNVVLPVPPPPPPCGTLFGLFYFFPRSFGPLAVTFMPFGVFSISDTVVSSGREASEQKRAEARRGQGQCWGEAGDGARELLPWTANPGAQKHFDPEHPLAGDSKGSSLALV